MDSKLKNGFNNTNDWLSDDIQSLLDMANKQSKLIGLFVIAMVVLNFPLLGIFSHASSIGGIPSVFIYLFVVWLVIIFLMRRNVEHTSFKAQKKTKDNENKH